VTIEADKEEPKLPNFRLKFADLKDEKLSSSSSSLSSVRIDTEGFPSLQGLPKAPKQTLHGPIFDIEPPELLHKGHKFSGFKPVDKPLVEEEKIEFPHPPKLKIVEPTLAPEPTKHTLPAAHEFHKYHDPVFPPPHPPGPKIGPINRGP
jgi:hypothetical protein